MSHSVSLSLFPYLFALLDSQVDWIWPLRLMLQCTEKWNYLFRQLLSSLLHISTGRMVLACESYPCPFHNACIHSYSLWQCKGFIFSASLPTHVIFCLFNSSSLRLWHCPSQVRSISSDSHWPFVHFLSEIAWQHLYTFFKRLFIFMYCSIKGISRLQGLAHLPE